MATLTVGETDDEGVNIVPASAWECLDAYQVAPCLLCVIRCLQLIDLGNSVVRIACGSGRLTAGLHLDEPFASVWRGSASAETSLKMGATGGGDVCSR